MEFSNRLHVGCSWAVPVDVQPLMIVVCNLEMAARSSPSDQLCYGNESKAVAHVSFRSTFRWYSFLSKYIFASAIAFSRFPVVYVGEAAPSIYIYRRKYSLTG